MVKPIYTRRAYCEGRRRYYFVVRMFKSIRDMHAYLRHTGERGVKHTLAMCRSFDVYEISKAGESRRRKYEIGEIILCLKSFRTSIVAHECAHAAIYWSETVKLPTFKHRPNNSSNRHEERFCNVLGNLARQVVNIHYDHLDTMRIH